LTVSFKLIPFKQLGPDADLNTALIFVCDTCDSNVDSMDLDHHARYVHQDSEMAVSTAAEPHDEYHTMAELYDYRMLYNAHSVRGWIFDGIRVSKSWRHHDRELCFGGGWFIVTAELPTGQVSNHYKEEYWDLFVCPHMTYAPEWDGHTPAVAAQRLRDHLLNKVLHD
jgi:hypothetical protein